jgi:hypothetical protein
MATVGAGARAGWACVLPCLLWTSVAAGHAIGVSLGHYVWHAGQLEVTLAFSRAELTASLPKAIAGDGSWVALLTHEDELKSWLVDRFAAHADGARCTAIERHARLDGDGVAFDFALSCRADHGRPGDIERLTIDVPFVSELQAGHRHVAAVEGLGADVEQVLTAEHPSLTVGTAEHARISAGALVTAALIVAAGAVFSWWIARARRRERAPR